MVPYRVSTTALKYHIAQNSSKRIKFEGVLKTEFLIFVPSLTLTAAGPIRNVLIEPFKGCLFSEAQTLGSLTTHYRE
jgi:hypothetical protein